MRLRVGGASTERRDRVRAATGVTGINMLTLKDSRVGVVGGGEGRRLRQTTLGYTCPLCSGYQEGMSWMVWTGEDRGYKSEQG